MDNSKITENSIYEKYVSVLLDGRYKIEKLLGTGGMAVVFRAHDMKQDDTVAIKMLRDDIAGDPEALTRFVNESRAVSMLSHPNIVAIRDVSVDTEHKYLVMEYIDGISLRDYMDKRGVLPLAEIISYTEQILSALAHAHSKGVVHRDIKPQNIMLLKNGTIKVMDFGIAKLPDSDTAPISDKTVGTVYYISPEQAQSNACDARSDLYSLGVMMYEMSTGKLPFDDESPISVVLMHMHDKPVPPRQIDPKIPRGLEQLILCVMEKNPQKRYQSAADMLRELRRIKKNPAATVRTPAKIAALKRSKRNLSEIRPSHSMTPVVLGVAFAVLIVGLVSFFYAFDKVVGGMTKTAAVIVPDLMGLDRETCEARLADELAAQDLRSGDVILEFEEEYSDAAAKGSIISQSPGGGAHKKVPCTVTLTVSRGPRMLTMPDYTITDWRTVKSALRGKGFRVTVVEQDNAAIPSGYVITTEPAPGAELVVGSDVTVYVSRGKSSGYVPSVKVPDFADKTEPEARRILDDAKLSVGKVTYTRSSKPVGTVLCQSPEPESDGVPGLTEISFVISGGSDFETRYIPSVTGMKRADASTLLSVYGLRTLSVRIVQSELEEGTVIAQDPLGTDITGGGTAPDPAAEGVTLTVSGGSNYKPTLTTIKVPRLTGRTLEQATSVLQMLGANIGNVRYIKNDAPAGRVLAQSVAVGDTISGYPGEIYVDVTVSGGPDWENPEMTLIVPDVVGKTLAEAEKRLNSEKLNVKVVTVKSDKPVGTVISQTPDSSDEITVREWEETVTLTVSGGPAYVDETTKPGGTTTPAATTRRDSDVTRRP